MFAAVAEHGSVGAALHITGPAVTQQTRKFERETHTRLIEPDGRGIRLTATGHVLAGPCEPALGRTLAVAVREQDDLPSLRALVEALRVSAAWP